MVYLKSKLFKLCFRFLFDEGLGSHFQNIIQVKDAVAQKKSNPACKKTIFCIIHFNIVPCLIQRRDGTNDIFGGGLSYTINVLN
jgi:hypothetical protein